jgi:hypothetical protein
MRHTVFGLFNTYAEADGARNALAESGFAFHEIELRANPETASDAIADESPGVLANIERFIASLFATSGSSANEPIAEHYTEAVRGGAVLVSVDAVTDAHAELAHATLTRLGARDVSERAYSPQAQRDDAQQAAQTRREHSMLDELGIGGLAARSTAARPPRESLRAMEEERRFERIDAPPHDTPTDDEAARTAIAAGGAPGSGAVLRPDLAQTGRRELDEAAMREASRSPDAPPAPPRDEFSRTSGEGVGVGGGLGASQYPSDPSDIGRETVQRSGQETGVGSDLYSDDGRAEGTAPQRVTPMRDEHQPPQLMPDADAPSKEAGATGQREGGGLCAPIPDEFLEYEEDFRLHYDEQYSTREGARYDEYVPAYRYGAMMGRDTRYQDRPWVEDVELEAQHDWERSAPEGSWDRFKAAVRHGWERVTGHHPHHH